jgi:hypothetical protein
MINTRLTLVALLTAGLAASPFAASAKMYKHTKHQTSTNSSTTAGAKSSTTTGANMKPSAGTSGSKSSTDTTNQNGTAAPGSK